MDRSEILKNILGHLKTEVPELQKVKAYEGELRAGDEKFLDETKGVFPCVLAVWDNRKSSGEKGTLAGQKNEIVFFLAMKDFAASDREEPTIYPLLDNMKSKLDRYRPELPGVGELQYKGDRHVAHNSFYVLYEQRFTVAEGLPV
ncbi:MAG: hypothetical protein GY749_08530, partial [Desulfobacteraceae bacterium]|nr:hypothetical protein [Desulfobacteraceae bacterium]